MSIPNLIRMPYSLLFGSIIRPDHLLSLVLIVSGSRFMTTNDKLYFNIFYVKRIVIPVYFYHNSSTSMPVGLADS